MINNYDCISFIKVWIIRSVFLFIDSQEHLLVKTMSLSTDNLPVVGMSKNSVTLITDRPNRPDMILTADCGRKSLNQINKSKPTITYCVFRKKYIGRQQHRLFLEKKKQQDIKQ